MLGTDMYVNFPDSASHDTNTHGTGPTAATHSCFNVVDRVTAPSNPHYPTPISLPHAA